MNERVFIKETHTGRMEAAGQGARGSTCRHLYSLQPLHSCLKTLVLCVDRDDDLGHKGGVETPMVGRRANVEGALALGLADPEDSDVNAVLSAVHLFDKLLKEARPEEQFEVATVTGLPWMGVRGDRKLAQELDAVLQAVRPDEVIIVTDGAEDERIVPIIQSRVRIAHVHRSVVKQAPRLEGFYYVLTRLLDDRKQALRFVLPVGLILLLWGIAGLAGVSHYATGATLAIAGFWLVAHAMRWEQGFGRFFADIGHGIRSGKVGLLSIVSMALIIALGGYKAYWDVPRPAEGPGDTTLQVLQFLEFFLPWLVIGLLVRILGRLFDAWFREGRAGIGLWSKAFTIIAFFFIGGVILDVAITYRQTGGLDRLSDFDLMLRLVSGVVIAMGGLFLTKYLRTVFTPVPEP